MITRVQLDDDVMKELSRLKATADARRIPLAALLRDLAEMDNVVPSRPQLSCDEFERQLDELAAEAPEDSPVLPPDFSRADIYLDHD